MGGICGGYQLLGTAVHDPHHLESVQDKVDGLGLLPVETTFAAPKIVQEVRGRHIESGHAVTGYHLRMGRTEVPSDAEPLFEFSDAPSIQWRQEGIGLRGGRLFGTSLHGLFDQDSFRRWWINRLRGSRGWMGIADTCSAPLDVKLNRLADLVERHLDMSLIDRLVKDGV